MVRTKLNPTAVTYVFTVIEDDLEKLEKRREEIWNQKKNDIALKGFRKGHVPRKHAESVVGFVNLYEEQIHELIAEAATTCEHEIVGIGEATVELFAEGQPVVVRTQAWIKPSVHITEEKQYKGLTIRPENTSVEDAEVDAVLQTNREQAAVTESIERPAERGDVVVLDYEGHLDDGANAGKMEKHQVVLGTGSMFAAFEEKLLGLVANPEITHKIEIEFPEEFQAKNLAGKKAVYDVVIHDVQLRTLPELNDDFAKQLGYESLEDARTKITESLRLRKETQSERVVEDQLLNALQVNIPVDPIPDCMVDAEAARLINQLLRATGMTKDQYLKKTNKSEEEVLAETRNPAMTNVRVRSILEAIAKHENAEPTEEEIEEQLQPYYDQFGDKLSKEEIRSRAPVAQITDNVLIQKGMQIVRGAAAPEIKTPVIEEAVERPDGKEA